jgi:tRNA (guanosine-2'-O-)-methyltransferase
MNINNDKKALIESLWAFISENKRTKMLEVIQNRTRYLTVVLEDIFQPHNASAVLRTCDIFGVQDIHVVEAKYAFKPISTVAMGASKWVDVHSHTSVEQSFDVLKSQGYLIVATTPHTNCYELPTLPIDKKMAFVFGSERTGLSDEAMNHADMFVKIPMYGFVESFNISVSVALCLYDVIMRLRQSNIVWNLSENERDDLLLEWMSRVSKTVELLQDATK